MTGNIAKLVAFFGVVVFTLSITYSTYLQQLTPGYPSHWALSSGGYECHSTIENYDVKQVMSISDSQSLSLTIKTLKQKIYTLDLSSQLLYPDGNSEPEPVIAEEAEEPSCEVTVSLNAPAFRTSPRAEKQTFISKGSDSLHDVSWVLEPTKMGDHVALVVMGSTFIEIPIVVTNNLGIPLFYSEILAKIGFFLGPMLTLPWWLDLIKKKRNNVSN
tara:strand:- start:3928 stop:4575 length:648 start_codon:yes stop_codon:yes gene_type:complete